MSLETQRVVCLNCGTIYERIWREKPCPECKDKNQQNILGAFCKVENNFNDMLIKENDFRMKVPDGYNG